MKRLFLKLGTRIGDYINRLYANPSKTILLSFLLVILVGTFFLTLGITANTGKGLSVLDALFTSTSAVCVTGLVVVDTLTHFSFFGQIVLILLIQIGGLGIMILSFFTIYLVGRRVSLANKMLLSYMLSEDDTTQLNKALAAIVIAAFVIEGIGALLLFIGFIPLYGFSFKTLWYAVFHSISAFCNAGFALFSDSLEGFTAKPLITLTISFLIIFGGIGFGVIANLRMLIIQNLKSLKSPHRKIKRVDISINNRIVIKYTIVLLGVGTLLFYGMEFTNSLKNLSLGEQYLAAFFQSVTMRTAGFNSVSYAHLHVGTYIVLCVFMFIGAASGSTAGGIKINTLAVLLASVRSYIHGEKTVHLNKYEIASSNVSRAFIILSSGIVTLIVSIALLSFSEKAPLEHIIFEVFSAMGTVGVSAGITSSLTQFGKVVIIFLMFWGRLGALTVLAAAGGEKDNSGVRWPLADISVG